MQRTTLAIAAVALLAVVAGCASPGASGDGGGNGGDGDLAVDGPAGDEGASEPRQRSDVSGDGDAIPQIGAVDRSIVRTGAVELTVADFESTSNAITAEARRFGGFVDSSSQTLRSAGNVTWTTGQVVVRVPSEDFSAMVSFAKDQGTVEHVETETEDVTDRLVELDARLTNLREKRERLRTFYQRAETTNELLSIEERLSDVQGHIEQLKAKQQSLEDRVAFSTLRVSIAEERPEPAEPTPDDDGGTTVASAFLTSFWGMVDAGYVVVLVVAAIAPYVLVLGVPGAIGYALYRRREVSATGATGADGDPDESSTESASRSPRDRE